MVVKAGYGRKKNKTRINAVNMRSPGSVCGVSQKDRCRNSDVRQQCGMKEDVVTRVGKRYLAVVLRHGSKTRMFLAISKATIKLAQPGAVQKAQAGASSGRGRARQLFVLTLAIAFKSCLPSPRHSALAVSAALIFKSLGYWFYERNGLPISTQRQLAYNEDSLLLYSVAGDCCKSRFVRSNRSDSEQK
ncbi:hypothetical protein EVAR_45059_1 [Eumeta japonica]|uniref:Uncharacterized protein n=1 Tax=Eumeta variegata TaxID=151549 RepID=A0A4C1ZFW8_EUMVA|nr:hypothetical protein EVAR_45059_1 [Eumeta japonica]